MNKIIIFFLFLNICYAVPIPIIGHTHNSTYIYSEMKSDDYIETLLRTKSALDEKVIQSLGQYDNQGKNWKLSKISVGLGATGEVGIGPYKFGKSLKQRFVFTR